MAVGYPFRSPWFDDFDGAAPLLVADWRAEPLPDLDRMVADRGREGRAEGGARVRAQPQEARREGRQRRLLRARSWKSR